MLPVRALVYLYLPLCARSSVYPNVRGLTMCKSTPTAHVFYLALWAEIFSPSQRPRDVPVLSAAVMHVPSLNDAQADAKSTQNQLEPKPTEIQPTTEFSAIPVAHT